MSLTWPWGHGPILGWGKLHFTTSMQIFYNYDIYIFGALWCLINDHKSFPSSVNNLKISNIFDLSWLFGHDHTTIIKQYMNY